MTGIEYARDATRGQSCKIMVEFWIFPLKKRKSKVRECYNVDSTLKKARPGVGKPRKTQGRNESDLDQSGD